jgi:hypothetical protein
MAPKKSKQQHSNESAPSFVVLHDEKNSRHIVVPYRTLVNCKTNQLKLASSASFNGNGDRSARCKGVIVCIGKLSEYIGRRSMNFSIHKARKNSVIRRWN